MSSPELENLVRVGQLNRAAPDAAEIDGLVRSGITRLTAEAPLSMESRFDLAYNAAHAPALAALRLAGYRSDNRYIVFQALPHTLATPVGVWRVLAKCHGLRNRSEYEGMFDISESLVAELITATVTVQHALRARYNVPTG